MDDRERAEIRRVLEQRNALLESMARNARQEAELRQREEARLRELRDQEYRMKTAIGGGVAIDTKLILNEDASYILNEDGSKIIWT